MEKLKEQFINLSALLTGFNSTELEMTGLIDEYFDLCIREFSNFNDFILYYEIKKRNIYDSKQLIVSVTDKENFNSLASLLTLLWYTGSYLNNQQILISSNSYVNSLVWKAIDAHPLAVKSTGFGSWSEYREKEEYNDNT